MSVKENVWRRMAETRDPAEVRAEMEPYLRRMLQRAANGDPGLMTDLLQSKVDDPGTLTDDGVTDRLAAVLCARLPRQRHFLATRDTVLLTETLA